MEWLLAEEVIFFLAALTASGLLLIGTLKRIRPPVRRGRPSTRLLSAPEDRAPSPRQDRAALALRLGQTLLDRALQDSDPTSDRRRRLIYRAIACLNRGIEAAVETGDRPVDQPAAPLGCRVRVLERPVEKRLSEAERERSAVLGRRRSTVFGGRENARARTPAADRWPDALQGSDEEEARGGQRCEEEDDFFRQQPFHCAISTGTRLQRQG